MSRTKLFLMLALIVVVVGLASMAPSGANECTIYLYNGNACIYGPGSGAVGATAATPVGSVGPYAHCMNYGGQAYYNLFVQAGLMGFQVPLAILNGSCVF